MKRSEQKEKRRNEILVSGLDLFIRKGLAATKIQDIADAVGMSVGLLFNYFESKEKLYEALVQVGITSSQNMQGAMDEEALTFFEIVAQRLFDSFKRNSFVTKLFVFMNQAKHNDAAPESVKALFGGMDYIATSAMKIEQGQKIGTIREGNPTALAIAFWGAVSGIAEEITLDSDNPIPESDWVVDILRSKGI